MRLRILFFCSLFSLISQVYATQLTRNIFKELVNGHATFQLGGYWRTSGSDQFIRINGLLGDKFTVNNTSDSNVLLGVGYFFTGQERNCYDVQYGLNGFYLPKTSITGTVIQEDLYENLSYKYNVTQYPIYAMVKTTLKAVYPEVTLNIGIGPNFIHTSDFSESSIQSGDSFYSESDDIFSGKTTTAFSATAGAGIKFNNVFGKLPLECGYQFYYLGQGKLKITNDQVQNALKTGTLYANAVMCAITI